MLATVFLIVALVLFLIAALAPPAYQRPQFLPLGLAFVVAAWLVPMVA